MAGYEEDTWGKEEPKRTNPFASKQGDRPLNGSTEPKTAEWGDESPASPQREEAPESEGTDEAIYIGNIGEGRNGDWIKYVNGGEGQRNDLAAHSRMMYAYYEAQGDAAGMERERASLEALGFPLEEGEVGEPSSLSDSGEVGGDEEWPDEMGEEEGAAKPSPAFAADKAPDQTDPAPFMKEDGWGDAGKKKEDNEDW